MPEKNTKTNTHSKIYDKLKEFLKHFIVPVFIGYLIAWILTNVLFINAIIPSGSMESTIMTGDYLLGIRHIYDFTDVERGDVVIFKYPDDESQRFIKRVIGLPGEEVLISRGNIYINGKILDEPYLNETWVKGNDGYLFTVPEDCYLVLGDNRNNSLDARYWTNTYVRKDQIIGKAGIIYYPFSDFGFIE